MFITLYVIIGLFLVLNEKRKKKIKLYVAGHQKTAAYSLRLCAAVFWWPAAYSVKLFAAVFIWPAEFGSLFCYGLKP